MTNDNLSLNDIRIKLGEEIDIAQSKLDLIEKDPKRALQQMPSLQEQRFSSMRNFIKTGRAAKQLNDQALNTKIDRLNQRVNDLQETINRQEILIASLEESLDRKQNQNNELLETIADLEEKISQSVSPEEKARLEAKLSKLANDLEEGKTREEQNRAQIRELRLRANKVALNVYFKYKTGRKSMNISLDKDGLGKKPLKYILKNKVIIVDLSWPSNFARSGVSKILLKIERASDAEILNSRPIVTDTGENSIEVISIPSLTQDTYYLYLTDEDGNNLLPNNNQRYSFKVSPKQ